MYFKLVSAIVPEQHQLRFYKNSTRAAITDQISAMTITAWVKQTNSSTITDSLTSGLRSIIHHVTQSYISLLSTTVSVFLRLFLLTCWIILQCLSLWSSVNLCFETQRSDCLTSFIADKWRSLIKSVLLVKGDGMILYWSCCHIVDSAGLSLSV